MSNNRKDLLRNKGIVKIWDKVAKTFVEFTVSDNIRMEHPSNPVEIKTPSGVTIFKSIDFDANPSFDWFHPGDLTKIQRLYNGALDKSVYDGSTAQNEPVTVSFLGSGDSVLLPGFNGDKTAVTVNSVKLKSNTSTTYTVTTDYVVGVDTATGMSYLTHVGAGSIPVGEELLIDYDYTPLEGTILKPSEGGALEDLFILIECFPNPEDLTKYRKYYYPHVTVNSPLLHTLLEYGEDNTTPNMLPVTLEYIKPDTGSTRDAWYWIDTYNV